MLGAAYQAKHGLLKDTANFFDLTSTIPEPKLICEPYNDATEIYEPMMERFRKIVKELEEQKTYKIKINKSNC